MTRCPRCDGRGFIFVLDEKGRLDLRICPRCEGKGKVVSFTNSGETPRWVPWVIVFSIIFNIGLFLMIYLLVRKIFCR